MKKKFRMLLLSVVFAGILVGCGCGVDEVNSGTENSSSKPESTIEEETVEEDEASTKTQGEKSVESGSTSNPKPDAGTAGSTPRPTATTRPTALQPTATPSPTETVRSSITPGPSASTATTTPQPAATARPTEAPQPTAVPTQKPTTQAHQHNWVAQTKTVHHEAVYTTRWIQDAAPWDEQVVVSDAWDEYLPVYEVHEICDCGIDLDASGMSYEEIVAHGYVCPEGGGSYDQNILTGYSTIHHDAVYETVHHDEVGHNEQVLVRAAYDETVADGYRCSGCGAVK